MIARVPAEFIGEVTKTGGKRVQRQGKPSAALTHRLALTAAEELGRV